MRNVTTFLKYISSEINISSPLAPNHHAAATVKWLQSCPTLCDLIDGSPLGSSVPGILQARTLEWVPISFSNAWKVKSESEVAQLCPIPSDPMDCSPPGSSVHGIFQARVLEWVVIAFSKWYFPRFSFPHVSQTDSFRDLQSKSTSRYKQTKKS